MTFLCKKLNFLKCCETSQIITWEMHGEPEKQIGSLKWAGWW